MESEQVIKDSEQTSVSMETMPTVPEETSSTNASSTQLEPPYAESERLSNCFEEAEADSTIHGFNTSHVVNITVIEQPLKQPETPVEIEITGVSKNNSCEGSDSGVEVLENPEPCTLQRTLSTNSANFQDFEAVTPAQSCDSSIISCCSNYEEAYNSLVRRNSTLLEEYKLRNSDGTSEGGSESSSVISPRHGKRTTSNGAKKKVSLSDTKTKNSNSSSLRSRSKPPVTPKNLNTHVRGKSSDRMQAKTPVSKPLAVKPLSNKKPTPNSLTLNSAKKDNKKATIVKASTTSKTPSSTPTDDGRWPSVNSKPAPLMTRSIRNVFSTDTPSKIRVNHLADMKTLDKYGTLPRRRKERSADNLRDFQTKRPLSRENSVNRASILKKPLSRETTPSKSLPPYPRKKPATKTKIYHETCIQTALTLSDIDKALAGVAVNVNRPQDVEKCDQELQVDTHIEDLEKLEEKHKQLNELFEKLTTEFEEQKRKLKTTEEKLKEEKIEKDGLKEELRQNTERVLAILGGNESYANEGEETSSDSLMVLETRFQNVSQVIIKQEDEISKLNEYCRSLQRDLDKSLVAQKVLLQQQQELEAESIELQEFMQAEKTTLGDALKDSECEIKRLKLCIVQKEKEFDNKHEECKHLARISEQRRQENMGLQARLGALEAKCRELLVHQGGSMSGAAVALSALISRLDGLVEELVASYEISDQELDDVIFHNEAYSNSSSSPEATPDKSKKIAADKTPSPTRGSFISAIINAIRNAAAQSPFSGNRDISRDNMCADNSDSTELLDSETEPCLMMEHVLEDVVIPDGHSHNMISSGHSMLNSRLTHSESLNNLSHAIYTRQISDQTSFSLTESLNASYTSEMSSLSELCPTVSVVDQVIDVDNLVTRLLKVIRIIQIESDDSMIQLQNKYDQLCEEMTQEKRANKSLAKQLEEWEKLGSTLKQDVKKLLQQLSKKNIEIEDFKSELNQQRKEVEKLNQDVCDLSTALSKSELELRMKEEEVAESLKKWEETNEYPNKEILARLVASQNEIPVLKEKLVQKEKQLNELSQEYQASKQVLSENWKDAVNEAKKQYDAIDGALEILHSIQSVVQQCPPLAKMQRDLEETNFQSASASTLVVPPDCNANAALLQAMANLEIGSPPINSTA